MSRILITGAKGQLGTELCYLLNEHQIDYTATDVEELDITDETAVQTYFENMAPEIVFHCAAYTAVDKAEDEGKSLNWKINVEGTKFISQAAENVGAILIYISTDYVFDGEYTGQYTVDAETNPKNEYGAAKLAGEQAVQQHSSQYYIVRTSWVFGQYGKNFVDTMLNLSESKQELNVVADQYGRPTWTRTLAEFLLHIYETNPEYGVYHLSNTGSCSWYEFACEILKHKNIKIQPVTSEEYPQKAYRPRNSIMSLEKSINTGFTIPNWKNALKAYAKQKK